MWFGSRSEVEDWNDDLAHSCDASGGLFALRIFFHASADFWLVCLTFLMFVETMLGRLCGQVLPANLAVALPWSCELCGTAPAADSLGQTALG
jgi:hypothetical protein